MSLRMQKSLLAITVVVGGYWTFLTAAASAQIFTDETLTRLQAESQRGVRADVGDVDNDGDLDVIVANGCHSAPDCTTIGAQQIQLQINDGNGYFTDEAATRLPGAGATGLVASAAILGDVDGDNDLDVFIANGSPDSFYPGFQNLLWINDGTGHFTDQTASRLPLIQDFSFHAAFGDVEGDGDLDIVVANIGYKGTGGQNRLLINNGTGVFTDETASRLFTPSSPADITYAVALADLDGVNGLDIVVANKDGGAGYPEYYRRSYALLNNGAGQFKTPVIYLLINQTAFDVAVADVDGTGEPDILFAGDDRFHVFRNYGSGAPFTYTYESWGSHGLAVADVDNDGDIDVFAAVPGNPYDPGTADHKLLRNNLIEDGSFSFTDVTEGNLPTVGGIVRYASFLDVENDGDADLYIPMWTVWDPEQVDHQDRLLINTTPTSTEVEVGIDIKPGSYPNCFNNNGNGVIPVAVLGSEDFDVTDIVAYETIAFATLSVRTKGNGRPQCSIADVSGDFSNPTGAPDGWPDLVCQFVDVDGEWEAGSHDACVAGSLEDDRMFWGCDTACITQ